MAALPDTGNIVSTTSVTGGNTGTSPFTLSGTCGASDNFLIVIEANRSTTSSAPSGITYNGVALAKQAGANSATVLENSVWYLANPPTGSSLVLSCTYAGAIVGCGLIFIPMSGVNLTTPFATAASNLGTGTALSVTAAGGGSNDCYLGVGNIATATSITSPGGNQINVALLNAIFSTMSVAVDYRLGANGGAFSWTGASSHEWGALAVAVLGASSVPSTNTQSMPVNCNFNPRGNSFLVTTNATINTPSAQLVSFDPVIASQPAAQASGLTMCPPQVCVANLGTAVVYVSFTSALRTAAVPATNPSLELPVFPGISRVFTVPQSPNVNSATPYALQINTISGTASQPLLVTFGEQHLT